MLLALAILSVPGTADPWNKLTYLTVHETVQVPGATLPPGRYAVRLADSPSNRNIVQFFNEDQSQVYATVLAIPNERMRVEGDTRLGFYETRAGDPPALRVWFYPGDTVGREFVYPKSQASIIAMQTRRYVPATDDVYAKRLIVREGSGDPPVFTETTRVYMWGPAGEGNSYREWTRAEVEAYDRKPAEMTWWERQNTYSRYYNVDTSIPTVRSVSSVIDDIEKHANRFEDDFRHALNTSGLRLSEREELIRTADNLEDLLDKMPRTYRANDMLTFNNQLRSANDHAVFLSRYMAQPAFSSANASWSLLKSDLDALTSGTASQASLSQ
jgi:hypothetical protein